MMSLGVAGSQTLASAAAVVLMMDVILRILGRGIEGSSAGF